MIDLVCMSCGTKLPVPEAKIGTRVFVCPKCAVPLDTPGTEAIVPAAAPAPLGGGGNLHSEDQTLAPDESALYVQQKLREAAEKRAQRTSGSQPVVTLKPKPSIAKPQGMPRGLIWGLIGGGAAVVAGLAVLIAIKLSRRDDPIPIADNKPPIEQKQPLPTPEKKPTPLNLPPTVASLIKTLNDGTTAQRKKALADLKSFGPESRTALAAVLDLLPSDDAELKALARATIAQWGPPTKADLAVYATALRDPAADVRIHAAKALADLGAVSKAELVYLRVMALDDNPAVQEAANKAVARIEEASLESLIAMMREKAPASRGKAAAELAEFGPNAKAALPSLMDALRDKNAAVRSAVRETLQAIGPDAVSALVEALRDKNIESRVGAIYTLGKMQSDARSVIPEMIPGLFDANPRIKTETVQALASMSDYAVPPLLQAIEREKTPAKQQALTEALERIGPEAMATLQSALKNAKPEVTVAAAPVVKKIASQAPLPPIKPLAGTAGVMHSQLLGWFQIQDRDKDGALDKAELAIAIRGPSAKPFDDGGKQPQAKDLPRYPDFGFLSVVDRDGDGRISRDEYERWSRDYSVFAKKDLEERQQLAKMQQKMMAKGLNQQMRLQTELAIQQSWGNYHSWRRGQRAANHTEWTQRFLMNQARR